MGKEAMSIYDIARQMQTGERIFLITDYGMTNALSEAEIHAYGTMIVDKIERDANDPRMIYCRVRKQRTDKIPYDRLPINTNGCASYIGPPESIGEERCGNDI